MNTKLLVLSLAAAVMTSAAFAEDGEMERPSGIKIGSRMTLRPYVSLSAIYDSNVDQSKHSKGGTQWVVSPGMDLDYKAENWSLVGSVWYQYHAYDNYSSQLNEHNYGENLRFGWADSAANEKGWSVMLSERFQQVNQDDDFSTNNGRGIGRDRKEFSGDGAVERRINEYLHAAVMGNYYLLDYDNDVNKYAPMYGWKRGVLGGELGYAPSKWTDILVDANYQWYDQDNDYNRLSGANANNIKSDSKGWSVLVGLGTRATEKITYRALAGWSHFEYGGGAKSCNGWTYQLSGNWKATDTLNFMVLGSSYYQPSETEYGSVTKVSTFSFGAAKSLVRGKLTATADVQYRNESREYNSSGSGNYDENIWTARFRLNYTLNRYLGFFGGIEYQTEESSGGNIGNAYDYDRWRGTLGARLTY